MSSHENLFLNDPAFAYPFTSKKQGGPKPTIFPVNDRKNHGLRIISQLEKAWKKATEVDEERTAVSLPVKNGMYLEFHSTPKYELATKRLENHRSGKGIRLMNVQVEETNEGTVRKATVFIPKGKENHFLKKVNEFIEKDTGKGKPKNEFLVANIGNIRLAVLESFWPLSDIEWIPTENPKWCEIWLNKDDNEIEHSFRKIAAQLQITLRDESLKFPERIVILAFANRIQLEELIVASPDIAEMRRAAELTSFFVDLENKEQTEWAREVLNRITVDDETQVRVCVLDTGVNSGHMLLRRLLNEEDCSSYEESWGSSDHNGHGTAMSGVVGLGDLQAILETTDPVKIVHKLESMKILPPVGENDPLLYGAITAQALSKVIIGSPERIRIVCMAITAPKYTKGDGSPTSWSAAIDELTAGVIDKQRKLFIISTGNVDDPNDWDHYPTVNKLRPVQNPAQSWNALAVGAYTEKLLMDIDKYKGYEAVAQPGELSPFSTTSLTWDDKWPIKPDIVLEGGNLLRDASGSYQSEDLSVLTTFHKPHMRQFDTIWATSAASAKAAWMAAQIQAKYPNAWPETVRALMVHSAEWTPAMKKQFLEGTKKGDIKELLRICGYGVPNLDRAMWCIQNSVNLVIQSNLQPYMKQDGRYKTNDMHIHELPWPKEVLLGLGETKVSMKVTLSYFIEPGPGEVGWKDRYRYASCALRFDVNGNDTREAFLSRINAAMDSEEEVFSAGGGANWLIGPNSRHRGSIHSDIWTGRAADLAVSNLIGVYPAVGWWRERHWLNRWSDRINYSLIVTIQTPEQSVDLLTPITAQIELKNKSVVEVIDRRP